MLQIARISSDNSATFNFCIKNHRKDGQSLNVKLIYVRKIMRNCEIIKHAKSISSCPRLLMWTITEIHDSDS